MGQHETTVFMEPMTAAQVLGVSTERVRQFVREGKLKAHRTWQDRGRGGRALFDPSDVNRLKQEREQQRRAREKGKKR